jgi:PKD domain-containing protein
MNSEPTRFGKTWPLFRSYMALIATTAFGLSLAKQGMADCSTQIPSNTPLNDLGQGTYFPTGSPSPSPGTTPVQGGLYPNGSNQRPEPYNTTGISIATNQIYPRNTAGDQDLSNGKIVLVSVGMCNALMEFGNGDPLAFIPRAKPAADLSVNPKLVLFNGAQAGADAPAWTDPNSTAWNNLIANLPQGISRQQVQVVWLKEAWIFESPNHHWPPQPFPTHAIGLQSDLKAIITSIKTNFPNCQITYISPRTRAYTTTFHNPEPKAYETGFAVKWAIADEITAWMGANPVAIPWVCWGPYLWTNGNIVTNGITGRSDGLTWECGEDSNPNDVRHLTEGGQNDFVHPSDSRHGANHTGIKKVADQLIAFFKTDPTAAPWFLNPTVHGQRPTANITSDSNGGQVPLKVTFQANASDPDGIKQTLWTFDDGDYSLEASPAKWFTAPGVYTVHLTVVDNAGDWVSKTKTITMTQ